MKKLKALALLSLCALPLTAGAESLCGHLKSGRSGYEIRDEDGKLWRLSYSIGMQQTLWNYESKNVCLHGEEVLDGSHDLFLPDEVRRQH